MKDNGNMNSEIRSDAAVPKTPADSAVLPLDSSFTVEVTGWYRDNRRDLPWRQDKDPYHVWLSEIMLQQTRVEAARGYYLRFMQALPTIKALAEAEEEQLLKLWQGLGYYNRVRNLQKAARQILQNPSREHLHPPRRFHPHLLRLLFRKQCLKFLHFRGSENTPQAPSRPSVSIRRRQLWMAMCFGSWHG